MKPLFLRSGTLDRYSVISLFWGVGFSAIFRVAVVADVGGRDTRTWEGEVRGGSCWDVLDLREFLGFTRCKECSKRKTSDCSSLRKSVGAPMRRLSIFKGS